MGYDVKYDATPDVDDVILSTWQERDNLAVTLSLRKADDTPGAEVGDWRDGECAQMFEDGFFEKNRLGKLSDTDDALRESVFKYALEHRLGALAGFEDRVQALVSQALDGIADAYRNLEVAEPNVDEEEEDYKEWLLRTTAWRRLDPLFVEYSEARRESVAEHLINHLEWLVEPDTAPTP